MRVIKWIAVLLVCAVVVVLAAAATLYAISARQVARIHTIAEEPALTIPTDSAALERGGHLATTVGSCIDCHAPDFGGGVLADMGPIGLAVGPNLTRGRGGVGRRFTSRDWERAIRHGVHPDGTSLIVMPSEAFTYFSDADVGAIVAFLQQLPPVDRELPRTSFRWLGRLMLAAGRLPLLIAPKTAHAPHVAAVDTRPSAAYGRYLADVAGCRGCHGPGLSGGRVPGPPDAPPAANLTPAGIGNWSEADFVRTMRERVRPDGKPIDKLMPAPLANLEDEELHALWLYLRSVPAKPTGNK